MIRLLTFLLMPVLLATLLSACTGTPSDVLDIRGTITNPRFGDNDPHPWQGRKPWEYEVHGIDVSKFQGDIDWPRVKQAGIAFAFIKATEGGDLLDNRFHENWLAARQAGIPRSAYHFFYFCRPAFEQVAWYIANVPREAGSLPPILDMEWNSKSPSCRFRPQPQAVRAEMDVFIRRVKAHYGQAPIIYTTIDFYRDNDLGRVKGVEFWLRSVAEHPDILYPGQDWTFWQYTGTGVMPGIEGNTDINVFEGTLRQWGEWLKKRIQ